MDHTRLTAAAEWKSGWALVLASAAGFSLYSMITSATGLFLQPMTQEFGWSRTLFSVGAGLASVIHGLSSPFFGMLLDRYGTRRLALPGIALTIAAVAAFSFANGSPVQWIALWVFYALVSISIKSTVWSVAVAGVFYQGRGLALGCALAGAAVSQTLVPPLGNWLIGEFGWRHAFLALALGWGGVVWLLALLFLRDVHDRAAAPRRAGHADGGKARLDLPGLSIREALRNWALYRVGLSTFIVMVLTIGLMFHLFPILTEAGISRANAAWLMSLGGIAGVVGQLLTGMLLDRFRPNWVGGLTLAATAMVFALLIYGVHSPPLIVLALMVNGYAAGTKMQICSYLTAGYCGMKNYGAIYGGMVTFVALGSGIGPALAGLVYDRAGGYEPFLAAGTIGCVLSALLIFSLPRYPDWRTGEAGQTATAPA